MKSAPLFVLTLSLYSVTLSSAATCEQGTNCNLPNCYCSDAGIPLDMNPNEVPQMVLVALDGNLDNQRDEHYNQLLPTSLRNPNGCRIGATMFVPGQSTEVDLVKKWHKRGIEIGLNSQLGTPKYNYWTSINRTSMKTEVLKPLQKFMKDAKILRQDIRGYRNPAFFAAGNVQYQVLEYEDFEYDASLRMSRRSIFETNSWPSTLDFTWPHRCVMGKCPTNTYTGLWVIPSVTLFNGTQAGHKSTSVYSYSTEFPATTEKEMSDFLWHNFNAFYVNDRTPFVLNINSVGFLSPGGDAKLKGFQKFFREALSKPGVFFVSMHQAIEWMRKPTPLSKIGSFLPWSCAESKGGELKTLEKEGDPISITQLKRKSKSTVLFGKADSDRIQVPCVLLLTLSLLQMLFTW
ncbi:chitin deacetylase 1-like [Liolophura sinensis]|uniref:chitin deacetylase 1-like n=1 Tax=Liolophura sinensis TaxID=3198878 RepID=UPI00315963B4